MSTLAAPNQEDLSRADVGLVCALAMELDHFFDRCRRVRTIRGKGMRFRGGRLGEIRIASVESGAGSARAARATRALIDGHRPRWILAVGFAGGLVDTLHTGNLVVADALVRDNDQSLDEIVIAHGMKADPDKGLHVGRIVTCDSVVRTVEEKRTIASRYDAIACDMESHAVAAVCRELNIRFMAVRGITDDTSGDLPPEVHALLAGSGARRIGATMGALWNRPESAKDLWALRGTASQAGRHLAPFLASMIPQLHQAP